MAYRFRADEPVGEATVRCAREQLDRAVAELSHEIDRDAVAAVHDARKAIKKTRALLRLARGAMGSRQRRQENEALREVARGLSATRDADVMVAALDGLSDRFAGQLPATTFDAIRDQVAARRASAGGTSDSSRAAAQAVQKLAAIRGRVGDWKLREKEWKALEDGLFRSYKRGRKGYARALKHGSLEDLHAWRKRVKDLWYHQRLLASACGPTVRGGAKEAHRLSDLLGDDHDLGLLREELASDVLPVGVDVDAVVGLLDHRRGELQAEALYLGERVYGERPKAFRRRLKGQWTAGRALARAAIMQHPLELAAATREPQPS